MNNIYVTFDEEKEIITVDNGVAYMELSEEDARYLASEMIDKITNHNIKKIRSDWKYDGNSL